MFELGSSLVPTPLIPLRFNSKTIWGKAEFLQPSGSVKAFVLFLTVIYTG